MPARDRVTSPAQVLRQIYFHLGCGLIGHRVHVRVQFRQEALMDRTSTEETPSPSSTLAVSFWFVHIHRQLDGGALLP